MSRVVWWRTGALSVLVVVAVCALAAPASAHASLVGSSPAAGARLTTAPEQVKLTFNENVRTPSTIIVKGPSGRVSTGSVRVVDNTVSIDVTIKPAPAYVGRYVLAYRVVSADGHPVTAEIPFDYQPPGIVAAPSHTHIKPASTSSGHGHTWLWLVGGVVVVGALAGLLLGGGAMRRTRSRA
jgi:methionine-rich copper-binding protein CopC